MLIFIIIYFLYFQNNKIVVTNYHISSPKLPKAFDGFCIVQISDVHGKLFGEKQSRLVNEVSKLKPDIIAITGDLVDRRRYREKPGLLLVEEIINIAPVYFVNGNHEIGSGKYEALGEKLKELGVTVLRDANISFVRGQDSISIVGIDSPKIKKIIYSHMKTGLENALYGMKNKKKMFKLLLAHRPEQFELYVNNDVDLVLSGHAHGGQIRLPFIGGLYAPEQGWFPKFVNGVHEKKQTKMVISRGLGPSIFPFRIFNYPEVVKINLQSEICKKV